MSATNQQNNQGHNRPEASTNGNYNDIQRYRRSRSRSYSEDRPRWSDRRGADGPVRGPGDEAARLEQISQIYTNQNEKQQDDYYNAGLSMQTLRAPPQQNPESQGILKINNLQVKEIESGQKHSGENTKVASSDGDTAMKVSAPNQDRIRQHLMAFATADDDAYLADLCQPPSAPSSPAKAPAAVIAPSAEKASPPKAQAIFTQQSSGKKLHRRIIDDDEEEAPKLNPEKVETKIEEEPKVDVKAPKAESSSSGSSSSGSSQFDSESDKSGASGKKRLEKEKMKKLQALKNELLRRQKEKDGQMSVVESAKFLKERSEEVVNIEAQKAQRAEERKTREKKLLAIRERKRKEEEAAELAAKKKPTKEKPAKAEKKPKDDSKILEKREAKKISKPSQSQSESAVVAKKPSAKKATPAAKKVTAPATSFSSMSYLVAEFAQRWNYALPAYPPADYDYKPLLNENKLNCVSYMDFQKLKNVNPEEYKIQGKQPSSNDKKASTKDSRQEAAMAQLYGQLKYGTTLVYEVQHYSGIFRDRTGQDIDLRPSSDTVIRPTLKTFESMQKSKLQNLLLQAYTQQVAQLERADHEPQDRLYEEETMMPSLKKKISQLQRILS